MCPAKIIQIVMMVVGIVAAVAAGVAAIAFAPISQLMLATVTTTSTGRGAVAMGFGLLNLGQPAASAGTTLSMITPAVGLRVWAQLGTLWGRAGFFPPPGVAKRDGIAAHSNAAVQEHVDAHIGGWVDEIMSKT